MSATTSILVKFDGVDGVDPSGGLIADANGDLFGTTVYGGPGGTPGYASGDGTVFEIPYSASTGYASAPTVLVNFDGTDGASPLGSLIADTNGDLFGTTQYGGANGSGTVFEITYSPQTGYATTPTVLASFTAGALPKSDLVEDANGDLFGTTGQDGTYGGGTVFEITKTATGYASTPNVLASFNALSGGEFPIGGLITDAAGDLFGTTDEGGANGYGTAFEIVKTASGYASTPTVLVNFDSSTEGQFANLVADANGDLFGTSADGGAYLGGAVYEIAKTATGYANTATVLASFNGPVAHSGPELNTDGSYPIGTLIIDAEGNLYGTTKYGGVTGDGTAFEIAKTSTGYAATPTVLYSFSDSDGDGALPASGVIADTNGDLLGTTEEGGTSNSGTVFEVTDSGFVVPPEVFSQVQAAASGPLASDFLWSNAANWTDGVPGDGDAAASHSAGIDDVAALTLSSLDLSAGGTVTVATPILTIASLTGDATSKLLADSTLPGSATTDIVIVDSLAVTGGTYGAIGPNTAFSDTSATSPGNASYTAADGGKLQVTKDLTIGGTAGGSLSVETGGTVTSMNGAIGTGTANAGTVTVDGADSSWTMSGSLTIGVQGGSGTPSLTISDKASVTTTSNVNSYDLFYDGSLTIQTDATLTQVSLDMHNNATLVVESGGMLNETGDADSEGLGANGVVTFDDARLASPNTGTFIGLQTGTGGNGVGTVTASDGSVATNFSTALGANPGDSGTLVLTGSMTTWTDTGGTPIDDNSAGLNVGDSGAGTLTVEAGAVLTNPTAYIKIGQFQGSTGTALVTGSGSTLSAGGLLRVGDSGTGTLTVENDATVSAGQVQVSDYGTSVGVLDIDSGASLSTDSASTVNVGSQRIANNGTIQVAAGSFDIGVQGGSNGQVDVDGGTVTVQGDLTVGNAGTGSLSIENSGAVSVVNADIGNGTGVGHVTLGVGGKLTATSVHVGALGTVNMAGGVLDPPDQITVDAAGDISGFGTVTGPLDNSGSITASGGTLDITGDVSGPGTLTFTSPSALQFEGTITNTAGIAFTGSGESLILGSTADVESTISGLGAGNSIVLEGQSVTSAIYSSANGQLAITGSDGSVFHLAVSGTHQQSDFAVANGEATVSCFLRGTRLAAVQGGVPVESLAIGDRVHTRFSGLATIKWIGHRCIDCRRHTDPRKVRPVRVRAGAFGDRQPTRDLLLSPDHAVFVDSVLIPVQYLINGQTIVQEAHDSVTYYHVELERHDAVFAEGLPCESYLDTGDRANFTGQGASVALYPDFNAWTWEAQGCAPLVVTGAALEAVQLHLQARADGRHLADRQAA